MRLRWSIVLVTLVLTACGDNVSGPFPPPPLPGGEARIRLQCLDQPSKLIPESVFAFEAIGCDSKVLQGIQIVPPPTLTVIPDCANRLVLLGTSDEALPYNMRMLAMSEDGSFTAQFPVQTQVRWNPDCEKFFRVKLTGRALCSGDAREMDEIQVQTEWREATVTIPRAGCPSTWPCTFKTDARIECR